MMLSVKNGCFSYHNKDNLLESVNFEADKGDILAILGANGAGKTTLLRCIMGFLKWKSGETFLEGKKLSSLSEREIRQSIAYVPQAKAAANSFTARETVIMGRGSHISLFGKPSENDIQKADAAMEKLKIQALSSKRLNEMSGGQLQMVLIARALAAEPKVLVLDEPESGLDFKNQMTVLDVIESLSDEGMTCIFNTHFPAHALQRANKALMLDGNGRSIFGSTGEIINEKNIEACFGVKAVIGKIETDSGTIQTVVPTETVVTE